MTRRAGREPRERRDLGRQVEGRRAVRELLAAGRRRVHDVWISTDTDRSPILDEIVELASAAGVRVRRVPGEQVEHRARTDAPQGVVAFADAVEPADLDALLRDPRAFLVALDGVTDPQNVGAVLRTAEAAGATGVVLPRSRSVGLTPVVAKAAAGALEHVPITFTSGIPSALERAARARVWCVGLDGSAETSLFDLTVADQPLVLVLGAEGTGLSRLTRARCDVLAAIPMRGKLASLNVSAAAVVACYEIARRRADSLDASPG